MNSVIDVLQQKVMDARNNPKKNDREVIIVTKETLKSGSDYLTLYLTSVVALDELGIAYDQVGGGANLLPWDSILRVHVRGKDLS